jgi:hypothetical protein
MPSLRYGHLEQRSGGREGDAPPFFRLQDIRRRHLLSRVVFGDPSIRADHRLRRQPLDWLPVFSEQSRDSAALEV